MNTKIFTFWEPKENIPSYLLLCMETWRKFLPEYEIVVLDYGNLEQYLGKNYFDDILYSDFSLPKQADAIRAAVLKQYGGVWLDIDTIITSDNIKNFININSKFITIGSHIAFIKADKDSKIFKIWDSKVKKNLEFYKKYKYGNKIDRIFLSIFHSKICKNIDNWNFLGNLILRKLFKTKNKKEYYSIDKYEINALPELFAKDLKEIDMAKNYRDFYFNNDFSDKILNSTHGIILLHNSWTLKNFLSMSKEEFLSQNCTISNLLKKILYED